MHVALVAPESASHVETAASVGAALLRRGHRVTYFGFADVEAVPVARGLAFVPLAPREFPRGTVEARLAPIAASSGLPAALRTMGLFRELARVRLATLPRALEAAKIDLLVADQLSPEARTVAELRGIPFVNICSALPINRDVTVPPFFTSWPLDRTPFGIARNRAGYALFESLNAAIRTVVNEFRVSRGLAPQRGPGAGLSPLLQLGPIPEALDFPYEDLPGCFVHAGPLQDPTAPQAGEWDPAIRDGRPLVYASFGTVNNGLRALTQDVLDAFRGSPFQLLLSLGGGALRPAALRIPPGAIVRDRVPQRAVLGHASAFITHAGVNSSLEALRAGVPMVAIPLTNDQPGMAARLARSGAARTILPRHVSPARLAEAVVNVVRDGRFARAAEAMRDAIKAAPGADGAATMIESRSRVRGYPRTRPGSSTSSRSPSTARAMSIPSIRK
jgi:MGT family glycosyltransferase